MARLLVRSPQTTVSNVLLTTTVPDQVCFLPCSVAQWLNSHCRAMDGQCRCTTGYQPTNNGDVCVHKVYDVCRDGKTRTQYGDCLDRYQWLLHCREQVCQSADDYQGYDGELGLCVCRQPPGRSPCDGSCRRRPAAEVELQCRTGGVTELVHNNRVSPISGSLLKTVFQQWDSRGSLLCGTQISSSHLVYIVQTTGAGFFGLLDGTQEVLREMLSVTVQPHAWSSDVYSGDLLEIADIDNVSQGIDYRWVDQEKNKEKERKMSVTGILNPAACFHLSDVILFTVDTRHYPLYDLDNLYNTNSDFDWGAFRKLEEQLSLSWTPPRFFSVVLTQPGVYVFKLSSHPHRHMYVRVMPAGGRCFEPGPFFPPVPRHMTRLGIKKRSNLLLRPDWLVTGGLLFGAAFILCTCVSVLILFTEYGWPEKKPIRVRYRLLQSAFHMEDFSSKGSRLTSLKRMHRNQLARMTEDSNQPVSSDTLDEFWDYEHQVDLEAFSSSTFYSLLLQQSQSVTVQLGRLTAEVRELYKGALGKLQQLYPFLVMQGTLGEGDRRIRMERVHSVFMAHLTESIRLEAKEYHSDKASCRQHQHIWSQKLTSMVNEMGEQISAECQRQGAWEFLGEGVGAKLLCPDTGTVLTKNHFFGDNRKWDIPLIPFIPYPTSQHSAQPLSDTRLRGLRPGQRLQLGVPMLDPDTGVPVPILAVTIHPQTGLVYPLGGLHICPITSLPQPIQIGFPMLDSRTGKFVLTVGVSLDPVTGAVVPVGGVMLAESFIEPLSGRMVRIGGASMRAGQMIPNAGGYQALLESKVLASMFKIQALLKSQTIRWESQQTSQQHPGTEGGNSGENELVAAAEDLREAWGRSLNCQLQLQARLELLLDWAICLQQDGGILALLGMEYPDPVGSGLSVPVLGFQTDLFGTGIPLAGTMEDPSGKGLVAIRYGSQTIDPVTGALARVVGARLDAARRTVIPVTVSYWQAVSDQPESVHVDALQREACARNTYWQQQRKREDDFLSDLDSAVAQSLFRVTESNPYQWSGRQLREAALEQQDLAQTEAQRRATGRSRLALVLPPPVLRVLMLGDEEEWHQQCSWNSALLSSLDKLDVSVEQLQQEQEKWIMQGDDWPTTLQAAAVLRGNFCYREYGLLQPCVRRHSVEVMGSLQQIALPLLERLNQLLEDKVPASFSPNPGNQTASEEEWSKLLDLSPLFQTLKELQLQLEGGGTALLGGGKLTSTACRSSRFIDALDAQWECEGELIPLDPSVLHSQELLVYEHGRSLITTMSDLNLEAEETLFVRRQRLRSVGGFTLLLLHCLSHVQVKDLTSDSSPAFQRLFFKVMQECLGVLVRAGLDSCTSHRDVGLCMGPKGLCWGLTGRSTSGSW
ncbi:hypothetical protein D4764_12G0006320 [Takifugu flavidus]|uniref:Uncharacterized protein n=1 Tax=Takifugu flavidus TaxID=433684 RepID=A0A5C6PBS4_9TELE|nr:hypothetical protein D4764_12G0006320 [Takifugu flavidus]